MADVKCNECALWISTQTRCRVTSATTQGTSTCALTARQRLDLLQQARAVVAGFRDTSGRMKVELTGLDLCPGGGHLTVTGRVNDGAERSLTYQLSDLRPEQPVPLREQLAQALVEFCRLCDVGTMAEAHTALDGQTLFLEVPTDG